MGVRQHILTDERSRSWRHSPGRTRPRNNGLNQYENWDTATFINYEANVILYNSGVRSDFLVDDRHRVYALQHYRASPFQGYCYRYYWRDARDRISSFIKGNQTSANPMENGRGANYSYDAEGQLTDVSSEGNDASGVARQEHFTYDALGNRQGVNQLPGRGAVSFVRRDNGLNQYLNWSLCPTGQYKHDDQWYGAAGNGVLMQEGSITASYNALNQPIAIYAPGLGSNFMYFGFDPLGRCVKRWIAPGTGGAANSNPATYFYYDEGWNLLQEGSGGATAQRAYVPGRRIDDMVVDYSYPDNRWSYHHYDARGHCSLLTDWNGTLLEQYDYDAFGKPYFYNGYGQLLSNGSAVGNRFLFTGREWLSDLHLYDYRNRMYQPELGRFLQPDPKEFAAGDYNLYRYCHNDPVNKSDPTGLGYEDHMPGPEAYQGGVFLHLSRVFDSLSGAGFRATWDAQSVFGDTSGKFAVAQGFQATKDMRQP